MNKERCCGLMIKQELLDELSYKDLAKKSEEQQANSQDADHCLECNGVDADGSAREQSKGSGYIKQEATGYQGGYDDVDCSVGNNIFVPAEFKLECDEYTGVGSNTGSVPNESTTVNDKFSDKQYQCNIECDKRLKARHSLMLHLRTHSGVKPYTCIVCGKSSAKNANASEGPYCCAIYRKYFVASKICNPTNHTRTVSDETLYTCAICGKGYKANSTLIKHIRTHSGEKPYRCATCGRSFVSSGELVIHTRTHTEKRLYTCDVCGKCFDWNSLLINHIRMHTGEKPYTCDICGKSFAHSGNLARHTRAHTGERLYSCAVCGKSYRRNYELSAHTKTHANERPYCSVCQKFFASSNSLARHKGIHNDERL